MTAKEERSFAHILHVFMPWVVWLSATALYIATVAPSIVEFFDDSLEFQIVAPTFGIAHPTGYPLYTLLGGLWSRVLFPFGNWAWRMNLFSALAAGGAVTVVFLIGQEIYGDDHPASTVHAAGGHFVGSLSSDLCALAAAVIFAFGPVWWLQATVAEVYALHGLFVAGILYVGILVGARQDDKNRGEQADRSRTNRILSSCFLVFGFSMAHHRTTLLLAPGLAVYLLWAVPGIWRPQRRWVGWFFALMLPLLLYLYIPLRSAMGAVDLNGSYVNTWSGFWDHVMARGYADIFFAENELALAWSLWDWVDVFVEQSSWIVLLVGLVGLAGLANGRMRKEWMLILITFVANLLFAINYRVGDVEVFLIPCFLCVALFAGGGAHYLVEIICTTHPCPELAEWEESRTISFILPILLLFASATALVGRGIVNRSQDWEAHNWAVRMTKVAFLPDSRVVGLGGQVSALKYMQQAEGLAQNATGVVADRPEARVETVQVLLADGAPTYLTQEVGGLETLYSFSSEGPLVRVWPRGRAEVVLLPGLPSAVLAEGRLLLEGIEVVRLDEAGGQTLRVALYWRPTEQLVERFKVSFRIDGGEVFVKEDRFPLRQAAYTDQWVANELIRDVHYLALPDSSAGRQEALDLTLILYNAESQAEAGRWQGIVP